MITRHGFACTGRALHRVSVRCTRPWHRSGAGTRLPAGGTPVPPKDDRPAAERASKGQYRRGVVYRYFCGFRVRRSCRWNTLCQGLPIRGQVAYLVYRVHSVLGTGLPLLVLCTSCSAASILELRGPGLNCLEHNAEGTIRVAGTLRSPLSRDTEVAPASRAPVPSCLHE